MKRFSGRKPAEEFSGAWFNGSLAATSVLEAVSLVTPVIEGFLIRTVSDGLDAAPFPFRASCLGFMKEEALHSCAHRKLNSRLLEHLGEEPPALARVEHLLDLARKRLPLSSRLAIASALEHFTAVFSLAYAASESEMEFGSDFARELFSVHAQDELTHRAVVFNLWQEISCCSAPMRLFALLPVLLAAGIYFQSAVPWILFRKAERKVGKFLAELGNLRRDATGFAPFGKIFHFAGKNFHPDHLRGEPR